ncbi:DUF732 domain-containing protein [Spirilliplanes yamanashiensis]|uniref:DUF732 domain-containing protein n=1 Tax=Spirilliplanes yamanashiensis TaxID=42233 RepID=A0A8J3Y9E1_9ACTN|nr:DUF732 domain-containing protein [Spirilliplanes yamanashiensis]MDP9817616.1 hypothetical protein [Spirilliplanes yamanashiensis]GIJ04426.1 hypothetical protein Sya03_37780 [Spirilliplanes yamanashiensis]
MRARWLMPAVLAVLTVLTTSGCGEDPPPGPPPATAAPVLSDSPSAPPVTDGREFVTTVREALPDVAANRTDDEIAALATGICTGLAGGDPADDLVATTRSLNTADAEATDHATARELIKLAIDVACPEHAARATEF